MNIAVAADGKNLESYVTEHFEKCEFLLIINMSDLSIKAIKNEGSVAELAKKAIEFDCEAIITGKLNQEPFNILADAYITRFHGFGYTVEKSLELMDRNILKLIRNLEGTEGCGGNHHH